MKIVKRSLIGFQILLILLGLVMMVSNIADTSKLVLPATAYDQRIFLAHLLNAVQVLIMFGAAIAIDTLITKFSVKEDKK